MYINSINSFSQGFVVKKQSKETTGGVHPKKLIFREGKTYLQKAGAVNKFKLENLTPVLECLVSDIGRKLGFNVVKYSLNKIRMTKSREWIEQDAYVSECEWFLKDGQSIIHVKDLNSSRDKLYDIICDMGFTEQINCMIVFDFLINSNDRHLKNFALIQNRDGTLEFSPIYDIGYSLTANCDEEIVEYIYDDNMEEFDLNEMLGDIDVSLSFTHSNRNNLRLIKNYDYTPIVIDDLLELVDKYPLSEIRKTFIKDLLRDRVKYLNKWGKKFERDS